MKSIGSNLKNNVGTKSFKSKQNFASKGTAGNKKQKNTPNGAKILSLSQLLTELRQERQEKLDQQKRPVAISPIIPPKAFVIILTEKPKKIVYNRRLIDYKHCGLLQRYLGLGGKILPRRQTRLTSKQQRFIARAVKSARVMGLLPFVSKERGFFR
jgi:ribosomal protein S18